MASEKRPLTFEDYWRLKTVEESRLSPDGTTVAYVVGRHDEATSTRRSAIWLADVASGATRQLTTGEHEDSQPRWAPDGARLAFVSTRHEDKPQVFLIPTRGGEARRLTTTKDEAHSPAWSPDGTRICFASTLSSDRQHVPQESAWREAHPKVDADAPRMRLQKTLASRIDPAGWTDKRTHLFLIDVNEGGEPRRLTEGDYDHLEARWSPDGEVIACLANRRDDAEYNWATDIWLIDVGSGVMRCLTDGTLASTSLSWSPDGSRLAFQAVPYLPGFGSHDIHVWTVSRSGGDQRDASAALDRGCGGPLPDYMLPASYTSNPPAWSPDSQTLYFTAADQGDGAVYALSVESGETRRIMTNHGHAAGLECTPDGQLLICVAATPEQPFEVCALPTAGGALRSVVQTNRELLDAVAIVSPQRVSFTGSEGWEVEGWLIEPVDTKVGRPHPLILHIHGGPHGMFGNTFYFQKQVLAGAGYASLYINPRGSGGYGKPFGDAADWGQRDYQDLMTGIDTVLAGGEFDPARLGVTGLSYGGFMTNWIVGHTDRFAGAVSVNGISNFISFYGVSDIGPLWFLREFPAEFGGAFWESPEILQRYIERSPITYVGNVTTPLLLLQSEGDFRCPIDQGEQMLQALRARGRAVELVRIPNATHVIWASGAPMHRYLQWRLLQQWFDRHVKEPDATGESEKVSASTAEPVRTE